MNDDYSELEFGLGGTINVTQYRTALGELYRDKEKFQPGETADSMEVLSAILQTLHAKSSGDSTLGLDEGFSNRYCSEVCPAHKGFALELMEQLECECGATSEPLPWDFSSFQYQIYVSDILSACGAATRCQLLNNRLSEALKRLNLSKVYEECPDNCPLKRSRKITELMSAADSFILNLVWSKENPKERDVLAVLALLPQRLVLGEMFSDQARMRDVYSLRGFIVYGFVHYLAYFKDMQNDNWRKYDDSDVYEVSAYAQVLANILQSRLHPVGVFYEKRSSVSHANDVSDSEWDRLEKLATSLDLQEGNDDENWKCNECGSDNAGGRRMCEKCYGMRPGVGGWACPLCSSVNRESDGYCQTCRQLRRYMCPTCLQVGRLKDCEKCDPRSTPRAKICTKCKENPANKQSLCTSCKIESDLSPVIRKSVTSTITDAPKSMLCPRCDSSLSSDFRCYKCELEAKYSSLEVQGSKFAATCTPSRPPPKQFMCNKCGRAHGLCACARTLTNSRATPGADICTRCNKSKSLGLCKCRTVTSDKIAFHHTEIPCVVCNRVIASDKKFCKICSGAYNLTAKSCCACLSRFKGFMCGGCLEEDVRRFRTSASGFYYNR